MRVRGVRLKGVRSQDRDIDLRQESGRPAMVAGLYGGAGSLKSEILRSIFETWGRSVTRGREGKSTWNKGPEGQIWIDFDLGVEIASVQVVDRVVTHSNALFRASSFSADPGAAYADGCCLMYDRRLEWALGEGGTLVEAMVADAHLKEMRDCVVLADGLDDGMSEAEAHEVYDHLVRIYGGRGNQLIFTTAHRYLERMVPTGMWFEFQSLGFLDGILKGLQPVKKTR